MRHLTRTYRVSESDEDQTVGLLAECGTTGVEVKTGPEGHLDLLAYFSEPPASHPGLPLELGTTVAGIHWVAEGVVEERDWQEEFRRHSRPIPIGDRFLIDPGEMDDEAPLALDRFLLRLPARTAFGTGSHETTQLTLEWMEELDLVGVRVLDVGSGSGILSLAAERLGASWALGFDYDLPSALMSGQYARSNPSPRALAGSAGSAGRVSFFAGTRDALAAPRRASDLFGAILVNVLPHRILSDAAALVAALKPGGEMIVSGVILSEETGVLAVWESLGMVVVGRRVKGEWVAWRLVDRRPLSRESTES
ncbi:MAG: 50S ribosomal protein L11 methyltransferase [Thermoanaerobaculia bacterium]|nr:50S ribosomal protein L11 methyltransferase [Thermoanaerobaculia bacterium]